MTILSNHNLSEGVQRLLDDRDCCVAIAFIGKDYVSHLLKTLQQGGKILCDISLGATDPRLVQELQSIAPEQVRVHHAYHGKFIVTPRAAYLGSANLSRNALGSTDGVPGRLMEVGLICDRTSRHHNELLNCFSTLWDASHSPDADELKAAQMTFDRRSREREPFDDAEFGGSLVKAILESDRFAEVNFAFTFDEVDENDITTAKKVAIRHNKIPVGLQEDDVLAGFNIGFKGKFDTYVNIYFYKNGRIFAQRLLPIVTIRATVDNEDTDLLLARKPSEGAPIDQYISGESLEELRRSGFSRKNVRNLIDDGMMRTGKEFRLILQQVIG